MTPRVRRRLVFVAAGLAAAMVAGFAYSYHRFPGVTVGMVKHAREATFTETRNLFACILYWLRFMEMLERDPATGIYGFPPPRGDDFESCQVAFHRGELTAAVDCMERRVAAEGASEERLFWLAMAYLRLAEAENCLAPLRRPEATPFGHLRHRHQDVCTLPVKTPHHETSPSRRAAELFTRLLDEHDPHDPLYRWLLNWSAMTTDTFPAGVPARYRVATSFVDRFYGAGAREARRRHPGLRFVERAAELGVDTFDAGRGVAVEDFDGDGDLDLVTGGAFEDLRFYRNDGGAGFTDATAEAGLAGVTQCFAVSAADYDDDGHVDLFVARPFDRYRLFRNRGGGRFVDTTSASGLEAAQRPGQLAASWASAWGDVDLDGDLDLFLAQWGMSLPMVDGLVGQARMPSKLFRNDGGRFVDATEAMGLARLVHDEYYVGATFGDLDGDRYPELFLSSPVRLASVLLHNVPGEDGARRYEPIQERVGRTESGFYAAFLDVDHDGRLDLFQGGFSDARTSTAMTVFGAGRGRYKSGHSTILVQRPDGNLVERNAAFGGPDGQSPMATMGAGFGDLDNDGCFDFYLGTGNPESWFVLPNLMYVGRRDGRRCTGTMDDVSMLEGFGTVQKGHGIVFFDFDGDGDQDVYSALGGMWPADGWPNQLFVNESSGLGTWVKVRLRGRETNRFGVGARVAVRAVAPDGDEIVRRAQMDNGTGFGSSPYLLHVGLLDAVEIAGIEVDWPVSGCRHTYPAELETTVVLDEADCGSRLAVAR